MEDEPPVAEAGNSKYDGGKTIGMPGEAATEPIRAPEGLGVQLPDFQDPSKEAQPCRTSQATDKEEGRDTENGKQEIEEWKKEQWDRIQKCWQEFNLEALQANLEFIKSIEQGKAAGVYKAADDKGRGETGSIFSSLETLQGWLRTVGYKLDEENDGWAMLGVPKYEGNAPSIELIEDRARRAISVLEIPIKFQGWANGSRESLPTLLRLTKKVEEARTNVLEELREVLNDKKKANDAELPRYPEPPWGLEKELMAKIRAQKKVM